MADEDTKSIPTDEANRAILGNVAMPVAQSGGKIVTYATNTGGPT